MDILGTVAELNLANTFKKWAINGPYLRYRKLNLAYVLVIKSPIKNYINELKKWHSVKEANSVIQGSSYPSRNLLSDFEKSNILTKERNTLTVALCFERSIFPQCTLTGFLHQSVWQILNTRKICLKGFWKLWTWQHPVGSVVKGVLADSA